MATAYTSLLGLALPVTGELQGTWGTTVNDSITSLLDTAVAGTTTLSSDADVTLSTTTGAANQARQAILLCSGARTVLRTITAPAQSKIYTVINATTGGFSVKLVGVGPTTGVTIVAGESALVAWNGSDFIKISNTGGAASFTNVTVSGTMTLSGLTASTALALNGSKEVVSVTNTGTGNNVLSASPTLTGTISAAAATLSGNLTLSGGTALGVLYLDGSKVATAGSALTFNGTTFSNTAGAVNGAGLTSLPIGSEGGQLNLQDTTGTFNAYNFDVDSSNQGRIFTTVNNTNLTIGQITGTGGQVVFAAGGSEGFRLDASRNLLIGSTAGPNYQVTVTGVGQETANLTDAGNKGGSIYVRAAGIGPGSGGAVLFGTTFGNATPFAAIKGFVTDGTTNTKGDLAFSTRAAVGDTALTQQMTLTGDGNLGIGTAAPTARLTVSSDSSTSILSQAFTSVTAPNINIRRYRGTAASPSALLAGDAMGTLIWSGATSSSTAVNSAGIAAHAAENYSGSASGSYIAFATTNIGSTARNEKMRLDSSGNLGLGVTPSAWYPGYNVIQTPAASFATYFNGTLRIIQNAYFSAATSDNRYVNNGHASDYVQVSGAHQWFTAPSGTAGDPISFGDAKMTLHASGGLSVGSTADPGANNIGIAAGGKLYYSTNAWITPEDNTIGARISGTAVVGFWTGGSERARITSGGNLLVGTTSELGTNSVNTNSTGATVNGFYSLVSGFAAAFVGVNNTASTVRGVPANTVGFGTADSVALTFGTSNLERARINSNGGFWIRRSDNAFEGGEIQFSRANDDAFAWAIDVYGSSNTTANNLRFVDAIAGQTRMMLDASGNLLVGKTASDDTTAGNRITTSYMSSAGTQDYWLAYNTSATAYRFYVTAAGTVFATNTTISAISDQRFKENIVDLDAGLDAVMALKPRKFDWKAGKGKDIKDDRGFIAQEFEQVFPDLIDEWKDPAPEGEEPYKAVRADLIPVLVKAIQEQQALITALTARVAALEAA